MERIQNLIDKLAKQNKQHDSPSQMLQTVQLLQQELMLAQQQAKAAGSSKVAVILPVNAFVERPVRREITVVGQPSAPKESPVKIVEAVLEDDLEKEIFSIQEPIKEEAPEINNIPKEEEPPVESPKEIEMDQEPIKAPEPVKIESEKSFSQNILDLHFDAMEETPTLLQQPQIELHELISEKQESLNDRLKQEQTELAHVLKDTPIKDLRKAIGINDKFAFVDDLFRGDEVMYERSIKTINSFHILQEAEYWINRELKVKLGWSDNKETVQHFYSLVRRRFS